MPRLNLFVALFATVIGQQPGQQPPAAPPVAAARPFALDIALEAAQAALASCQAAGAAGVVEVLDPASTPRVGRAPAGSRANRGEFARRKAYTVIKTGMSSAEFGASV